MHSRTPKNKIFRNLSNKSEVFDDVQLNKRMKIATGSCSHPPLLVGNNSVVQASNSFDEDGTGGQLEFNSREDVDKLLVEELNPKNINNEKAAIKENERQNLCYESKILTELVQATMNEFENFRSQYMSTSSGSGHVNNSKIEDIKDELEVKVKKHADRLEYEHQMIEEDVEKLLAEDLNSKNINNEKTVIKKNEQQNLCCESRILTKLIQATLNEIKNFNSQHVSTSSGSGHVNNPEIEDVKDELEVKVKKHADRLEYER